MTPPGIDPGTVRLVAQLLNHYATPGPVVLLVGYLKGNIRQMFFSVLFMFCFCFVFLLSILFILCFCTVLCIVSPFVYSCLFPISVPVYRPLPQGGNPIAIYRVTIH